MASRLFALIALLLIVAGIAAFLITAGRIPWTYPIALFLVGLVVWGFVALRRTRRNTPAPSQFSRMPRLALTITGRWKA